MTVLERICRLLTDGGVSHALIGAAALAAHGVTRSTADLDLMATDPRCLRAGTWAPVKAAGVAVDIRVGDADDPLAGVVRLTGADDAPVDVIVGRHAWQADVIARATPAVLGGVTVPIVEAPDLVLLTLYAGGTQDAWDIDQLMAAVPHIAGDVEARLRNLPVECAALWRRIMDARTA